MNPDNLTTDALSEADRIQEELVAYLDGELDAAASDRVEARLGSDPLYRQKLKELQSAWDMLEQLPRAHVSDNFTRSTIEMVALSAAAEVQETRAKGLWQHRLVQAALAVSLLMAALVGYSLIARRLDRPNQQLVRDLPVIEKVDLYRVADNVEFLRELDQSGLFDEEQSHVP